MSKKTTTSTRTSKMTGTTMVTHLLAATALMLTPTVATAQTVQSISRSDRAQGAEANPQLVAEFGGRYDGPQAAYVERVGKRVALQSGLSNSQSDFTVQLLNSPIENAFAIPGGYVYVTRQLLALMNSEDELAFVMGHEVGHVAARHSAGRQRTSAVGGLLAGVIGAVAGDSGLGQLIGSGARQATQLYALKFGRDQEYQADTLGVRYVAGAGYNPGAAPLILAKLGASTDLESRVAGRGSATVPTWLSTHPSSAARVAQARTLARQSGRGTDAPTQDTVFLKMLDGLRYGDDPSQGVIDGQTFRQPAMRIKFTAPTGYTITNGTQAVTVQGASGQAQLTAAAQDQSPVQAVARRFEALGGQIPAEQVRETSVGGRRAATATVAAAANNQRVDATVVAIAFPLATYVWTMITPSGDGGRVFDPMLASFTSMTAPEADAVRGKRILVYTVRAGDTIASVSRRMAYPDLQTDRFLTLNGLTPSSVLTPGTLVKLVIVG